MGFIFFVFQVFIVFLLSFVQRRAKAQPFENRFPYLRGRFGIVVWVILKQNMKFCF